MMNCVYTRPTAPVPAAWSEGPAYRTAISSEHSAADIPWREFFSDPKLQQVIELANNRDLRLATPNAARVKALYGVQRSAFFPPVTAFGGGAKQRASAYPTQSGKPRTTERYDVNFGILSREVNLFGRIRSLKEQALQEYLATEEARRGVQVALISAAAGTYLALAADQNNLNLTHSTLKTQEDACTLTQKQFDVGVAAEMDLRHAQTQVDAARADRARCTQRAAQESIVQSLTTVHKLAEQRYQQRAVSYLEVLDAQRSLYALQQGLNGLRLARLPNKVRLYAVRGGGAVKKSPK